MDGSLWQTFTENHEAVRTMGLFVLGLIGLLLAIWRANVADRHSKTAQATLGYDRLQKGAIMLGDEKSLVRQAAVLVLRDLAFSESEAFGALCSETLLEFLGDPIDAKSQTSNTQETLPADRALAFDTLNELVRFGKLKDGRQFGRMVPRMIEVGISFAHANLQGVDLSYLSLKGANFEGADFRNARLEGIDLSEAILSEADFSNADLRRANLSECKAQRSVFKFSNLRKAVMDGGDFTKSSFSKVNLSDASMKSCDLSYCNFQTAITNTRQISRDGPPSTILDRANLTDANLESACFCGAVHMNGTRVTVEQLTTSCLSLSDAQTRFKALDTRRQNSVPPKLS